MYEFYVPIFSRKLFLYLLNDGRVAGIPLGFACFTPISHKLLNGGLQLVHVERRRRPGLRQVVLVMGNKGQIPYSWHKNLLGFQHRA